MPNLSRTHGNLGKNPAHPHRTTVLRRHTRHRFSPPATHQPQTTAPSRPRRSLAACASSAPLVSPSVVCYRSRAVNALACRVETAERALLASGRGLHATDSLYRAMTPHAFRASAPPQAESKQATRTRACPLRDETLLSPPPPTSPPLRRRASHVRCSSAAQPTSSPRGRKIGGRPARAGTHRSNERGKRKKKYPRGGRNERLGECRRTLRPLVGRVEKTIIKAKSINWRLRRRRAARAHRPPHPNPPLPQHGSRRSSLASP